MTAGVHLHQVPSVFELLLEKLDCRLGVYHTMNVVNRVFYQSGVNIDSNQKLGVALRGNLKRKGPSVTPYIEHFLVLKQVATLALGSEFSEHQSQPRIFELLLLIFVALEPVAEHLVLDEFLELRTLLVVI